MSPAIIKHHALAVDARGEFFELPREAVYILLKRVSGGRPAIIYRNGEPLTLDIDATVQEVIRSVNRACTVRIIFLDADGNVIPRVPVGILEILYLKEHRPDAVVVFFGSTTGFYSVVAGLELGIPTLVCLRGNDLNRDFFSPLRTNDLSFAIQNADAIACVSAEMARRVHHWFERSAHVIHNSVNRSQFYFDGDGASNLRREWEIGDRPVVGLFGEFKPARGLQVLDDLGSELADAVTIMVGKVRREVEREIPPWVRRIEWIHDIDALRHAYSMCEIVLQPSLRDGMANVVLEAMACERVIVAAAKGGIADIVQNGVNGFLFEKPSDCRSAVAQALAAERTAIGREARYSTPEPSLEDAEYEVLIRSIVESK